MLNRIALAALATLVLAVAATTAQADARKAARQAGEISFYLDINQPINSPSIKNPLVVRPATIYLFEDGSWVIKDLQWSGWGTSVASASGTSSASDCKPDCASGQRKETPARFMLSSPGLVLGHQVYRCYRLVVPAPATNLHGCLGRIGSLIGYTPAAKPNLSAPKLVRFYTPSHNIECEMSDNGGAQSSVFCDMEKPGAIVSVFANGHVNIQRGGSGNFGEGPAGCSVTAPPSCGDSFVARRPLPELPASWRRPVRAFSSPGSRSGPSAEARRGVTCLDRGGSLRD